MKEFAIIKDEPLTSKVVSMDYVHGYNDAIEKACEAFCNSCMYKKRCTDGCLRFRFFEEYIGHNKKATEV